MVIVHVFDQTYWSVRFGGTPYKTRPRKADKAREWATGECDGRKADIVYNLAYFNMADYSTVNYVHALGYDVGYGGVPERVVINNDNVCGGYAVGIRDNSVVIGKGGTSRTRNGIGITALGRIVVAQSTAKITERNFCLAVAEQVSMYYKDRVKLFLMEDGGGSTQMYSAISKLGIAPEGGRKVPTVTCATRKTPLKVSRVLKIGCKGEDVRYLQMILGGLECDGSFGNATRKRVKECQKALGLSVDGSCGPLTQAALGLR